MKTLLNLWDTYKKWLLYSMFHFLPSPAACRAGAAVGCQLAYYKSTPYGPCPLPLKILRYQLKNLQYIITSKKYHYE